MRTTNSLTRLRSNITGHASNPVESDGTPYQALLVKVAGVVKVKLAGDNYYHTFASGELSAGVWHPMQVTHVHSDTDAEIVLGRNFPMIEGAADTTTTTTTAAP